MSEYKKYPDANYTDAPGTNYTAYPGVSYDFNPDPDYRPHPGGIYSGPIPVAPDFWVRADLGVTLASSVVSAWADQSGSGFDFANADPATGFQLVDDGGIPALYSPDGTRFLSRAYTAGLESAAMTMFVVAKFDVAFAGLHTLGLSNTSGVDSFDAYVNGAADPSAVTFVRGSPLNAPGVLAKGTRHAVTVLSLAGVNGSSIFRGGTRLAGPSNIGVPVAGAGLTHRIGKRIDGVTRLTGHLYEIAYYRRALSDAEVGQLAAYANVRYGTSLT